VPTTSTAAAQKQFGNPIPEYVNIKYYILFSLKIILKYE
jgi:hypothetical protein